MSIQINLGAWNSVFAIPSAVVDEGLKFSDGVKLKVLLYVLRHSGEKIDEKDISLATGVNITDIPEALEYWISRDILFKNNEIYLPAKTDITTEESLTETLKNEKIKNSVINDNSVTEKLVKTPKKENIKTTDNQVKNQENEKDNNQNIDKEKNERTVHIIGKPQKPDYVFTAQQLAVDEEFKILVNEAQTAFGKTLSNSDASTLLMLKNTCGLPIDVIIMLIQYCISIDMGNMRAVESIGVRWSDDGIFSIEAAENKIKQTRQANMNFTTVSNTFGLKNIGSPTAKQIEYANLWVEKWKFSTEMLREAYERCVDKKGLVEFKYVHGILKRWQAAGVYNLKDLEKFENSAQQPAKTNSKANTSYDINDLEKYNYINKI